jgi:carbon-monoxide dehydrogenase large subunit
MSATLTENKPGTENKPANRHIGRSLRRFEDARLTTGRGRYTDDTQVVGAAVAWFVRSPHAHAEIGAMDASAALASPGVLAVLSAADYIADGHNAIRHTPNPADAHDVHTPSFGQHGGIIHDTFMWPLADGRARFVGEPVAVVVAETLAQARDAAELLDIAFIPIPSVISAEAALAPDAPLLWPQIPGNLSLEDHFGAPEAVEAAFAAAHHVESQRFVNQRIANAQMEPRAVVGDYDAASGRYTLHTGSQGVVRQRVILAQALGVPPPQVRVVTNDVGGGFGPRSFMESEAVLVCWASRRLGRVVRWRSDRSEAFLTDFQARDLITDAALAFDAEGRITAMRVKLTGNTGAHSVAWVSLSNGFRLISTVYHVPVASVHVRGVLTNTPSTVAFRGAGRPEATYAIERLLDLAAPHLGLDRIAIRERNLVPHSAMPYTNVMGLHYDCGDFAANMQAALRQADWDGFPARRAASEAAGRRRGIAVANYVESPVGAPRERIEVTVLPDDIVEVIAGTQSTGQGHETSFAQVMADQLGVEPEQVRLVTGDTDRVAAGGGTHSDRSMRLAGTLMVQAGADIARQARERAAELLEVPADQVQLRDGLFGAPGSNRTLSVFDLARAKPEEKLAASADFTGRMPAFPTGSAVCELEVDPETGSVALMRYSSVDDAGQAINPMIVEGQTFGGMVQGIGQALCEDMRWDDESGQVLTGSFMDYAMPRADMVPSFQVSLAEDPTGLNPLRVKGGGEGGLVPALAAVIGAICDALAPEGVTHIEMPATPLRVWRAIQDARAHRLS